MDPIMKTLKDAAGISKFPMDLSIVRACWTEKLTICAYTVQNMIVVAQIGSNPVNILTSSTVVTEQRLHGFGVSDASLVLVSLLVMIVVFSKHLPSKLFIRQYKYRAKVKTPICRLLASTHSLDRAGLQGCGRSFGSPVKTANK